MYNISNSVYTVQLLQFTFTRSIAICRILVTFKDRIKISHIGLLFAVGYLKPLHNLFYIFYVYLSIILIAVAQRSVPQGERQGIEPGTFSIEAGELAKPQPKLAICHTIGHRAQMFKLFRSPRIDSKESIPPAHVAWRAGTTTFF